MEENEKWKDIKGYYGRYQISTFGRVKSIVSNKIMRPHKLGSYLNISLRDKDQKLHSHRIHRLVATHFIDNPNNEKNVDHIDHNKLNNHVSNLRWVSQSTNINHYNSIKKKQFIRPILQFNMDGDLIREWININELCENKNYNKSMLYMCLNGKYKSAYGYRWKYKNERNEKVKLNEDEIFKNIGKFYEYDFSDYEISNYGKLKTNKYNKIMKLNSSTPYFTVFLYDKITNKGKRIPVHRLVAYAFVEGRTKIKNCVDHIDENKRNNYYKNLQWTTLRDNTIKSIGKRINKIDRKTGRIINTFDSIADASKALGYEKHLGNIVNCCKGSRKTAYGYKWSYAKE